MPNLTKIYVQAHLLDSQSPIEIDNALEYVFSCQYESTDEEQIAIDETLKKIMAEVLKRGFESWDDLKNSLKENE